MVNVFRDWLNEHISYIDSHHSGDNLQSDLCDHGPGLKCGTVAGFFRLLSSAGDGYLPGDHIVKVWPSKDVFRAAGHTTTTIKDALAALKAEAAEIARPLVQSSLQGVAQLDYLTCVEVSSDDIHWEAEETGDEDDD